MRKSKLLLAVLTAGALIGLTGCDEIVAKPEGYDQKIVINQDIYHNEISRIYDAIHDAGLGSDALNKSLSIYAEGMFGTYKELLEVVEDETKGKVAAFVAAHPYYKADSTDASYVKIKALVEIINERISTKMYEKISGGSYSTRSVFSEKMFVKSLYESLENDVDPAKLTKPAELRSENTDNNEYYLGLLLPEVEPKDVFGNGNNSRAFLHLEYYEHYIEKSLMEGIYKELLTQNYVSTENFNTLGRSYARKVNIISLTEGSDNVFAAELVMRNLVKKISTYGADPVDLNTFKLYSNAFIGTGSENSVEDNLLTEIDPEGTVFKVNNIGDSDLYYRSATDYGDLMEKYAKIKVSLDDTDTDVENEFTGNNAYPKEIGLLMKQRELLLKDHTTTGWFIKNGGLTELPETIRTRLFNISVASGVKETSEEANKFERVTADGYKVPENESSYVARVNGAYYLKKASRVSGDDESLDILHYDSSSKTYYIVQILEAVSSTKMNPTGDNSYATTRGAEDYQEITNEVCHLVSSGSSYESLATKYYLEKMSIKYHDQSIYDYFEANYPELFED